jgi:hypothetical protein
MNARFSMRHRVYRRYNLENCQIAAAPLREQESVKVVRTGPRG